MSKHFRLATIIGRSYDNDPDDTLKTKKALKRLGYYESPKYGMTPYTDESLFRGIEEFQGDFDLKTDGVIKPDRQTATRLGAVQHHRQMFKKTRASFTQIPQDHNSPAPKKKVAPNLPRQDDQEPSDDEVEMVAGIPLFIARIAARLGLSIIAAYQWWLSQSPEGKRRAREKILNTDAQDEDQRELEKRCERMWEREMNTCDKIYKMRGAEAARRCSKSAMERFAACKKGKPEEEWPPLDIWVW